MMITILIIRSAETNVYSIFEFGKLMSSNFKKSVDPAKSPEALHITYLHFVSFGAWDFLCHV
jgi:hypothetical protein